jgi:Lar family restriction alleviation protein
MTNDTQTAIELAPCPFCGSDRFKPEIKRFALDWCVLCTQCGAETGDTFSELDAVNEWNARTLTAEIARLRTALEFYADTETLWEPCEDNGEHGLFRYSICGTMSPWTVALAALKGEESKLIGEEGE